MKHFRLFAILLLLVCKWTTVAHGQTQEPAINIEFTDIPLSEAISRIEKSSKYTFFYDAKQTDLTLRVSLHAKQLPISAALRQMLAPTGLDFTISERQIALIPAARKAPAGSRTITGTVNDSHELPLAGVAVTLEGDNTAAPFPGTTAVSPSPFPTPMRCSASPTWATSPRKSRCPSRRTVSRYSSQKTP